MPKEYLTGSLEEQCNFLYELAQEKMEAGNYTGAVYALQEIVEYDPDYRNASELLEQARRHKSEQRNRLVFALLGAALFVGAGTVAQVSNDLFLMGLAVVGLVVGYVLGNLIRNKLWRG